MGFLVMPAYTPWTDDDQGVEVTQSNPEFVVDQGWFSVTYLEQTEDSGWFANPSWHTRFRLGAPDTVIECPEND